MAVLDECERVREYLDRFTSNGRVDSFESTVLPCTWENLYPNMFVRHLVITQYEMHDAPRVTNLDPKGPAAPWYEPEHFYVLRTRDGDLYLGSCDTYSLDDEDFSEGVVIKKYQWKLPVEDSYAMLVFMKWRAPPISYIKLDCVITRDGAKFASTLSGDAVQSNAETKKDVP